MADDGASALAEAGADETTSPLAAEGPGLIARSIGKSFRRRPVVRDVSLQLRRGEAVGLLGPNGAGKTTCFYMITGLIPCDTGQIEVDGVDATELPMYRRARLGVGYLPQEASIFRGLTVEENIRAVLELAVPERGKRNARLDQLLAEFSITHLRRTPAQALSGGERRRVEIARCLASDPAYVLLDEPFAALGPALRSEMLALVTELLPDATILMVTHDPDEAQSFSTQTVFVEDGEVTAPRGTAEMYAAPDEALGRYLR